MPHPSTIVVLQLPNHGNGELYGWYVTRARKPYVLIRVPAATCCQLMAHMASGSEFSQSSLVMQYVDVGVHHAHLGVDFNTLAYKHFAAYGHRVINAVQFCESSREQSNESDACEMAADGMLDTCVVCLEESASTARQCRRRTCEAKVCNSCHSHCRGLCPVCDRTALNANYSCARCNKSVSLRKYGYPCILCSAGSLCEACYVMFGQCEACESV